MYGWSAGSNARLTYRTIPHRPTQKVIILGNIPFTTPPPLATCCSNSYPQSTFTHILELATFIDPQRQTVLLVSILIFSYLRPALSASVCAYGNARISRDSHTVFTTKASAKCGDDELGSSHPGRVTEDLLLQNAL
jgi:hypothetical protein